MAKKNEEEVACPVCGKNVGLEVPSCPHCGAEFDDHEEEPVGAAAAQSEAVDEEVACPVCGAAVGLSITSCPKCGAEFEEEEIEEVIEVEEKQVFKEDISEDEPVPMKAAVKAKPKPTPAAKPKAKPKPKGHVPLMADLPASIMDFRVIGVALIILGIIGAQVALMIDWYWGWVPPIEDNLGLFIAIPVVLLFGGILAFMLIKKALSGGKELPSIMPSMMLSIFLFAIFALIVMVMWDPINSALQDSKGAVAGGFLIALIVGVLLLFM
ncbi:MAG: hypothetical protein E4H25_07640, partial [Methanomassiliicoccus sp.]